MPVPRAKAEALLDAIPVRDVDDLLRIEDIAWVRGALVRDAAIEGAEARLAVLGERAVITVSTRSTSPQRRRFAIAHELGHLEMHREASSLSVCVDQDLERPSWSSAADADRRRESDANEFASHLLVPDRFALPMTRGIPPSLDLIRAISTRFDVSLRAAGMAYMRLCKEACAVVYSSAGAVRWFERSKDMRDWGAFVEVGPIDQTTIAASFFRGRPMQSAPGRVDAAAWLTPGRYRGDGTIREQSIAMPNYNATFTLLWIDRDIGF